MSNADAGALFLLAMAVCYFWPTIEMLFSYPKHALGIFAGNLFFGWTLIGWLMIYFIVIKLKANEMQAQKMNESRNLDC